MTSSGRSSTRTTISLTSGLFVVMALAIDCMIIVLPALDGDQASLSLADGRDQIDDPTGELVRRRFELQPLLRIERGEFVEILPNLGLLRIDAVDRLDPNSGLNFSRRSPSRGVRISPVTTSPLRRPNFFTMDSDT